MPNVCMHTPGTGDFRNLGNPTKQQLAGNFPSVNKGKAGILFFEMSACPYCRDARVVIQKWINRSPRPIYNVKSSNTELLSKFVPRISSFPRFFIVDAMGRIRGEYNGPRTAADLENAVSRFDLDETSAQARPSWLPWG